jgi:hypothetical protein
MPWRKLLVLAAFFWAAPLPAREHPPAAADRAKAVAPARCAKPAGHEAECPRSRRVPETIGGVSFPPAEYPPAENFLFDNGRRPPKFFP